MTHDDAPRSPAPEGARRRWKFASIPVTVLVIVAGVLVAQVLVWVVLQQTGTTTEHSSGTFQRVPDSVTVEGDTAEIDVVGTATDQVSVDRQVEWARTEPEITETWHGKDLDVDLVCSGSFLFGWFNDVCRVDYRAEVPSSAAIDLTATTGSLTVADVDSAVAATTTTGSVNLRGVGGDLETAATTGSIRGTGLAGEKVTAETTTGDIELAFDTAPRKLTSKLTTGDIVVTLPDDGEPYRVTGRTGTGDRDIRIATDPDADRVIDVSTTTGDVTIEYRG